MGQAIWLYGWLILRQTRERDGVGLVLGGHPVNYREIESETGFCRKTLERWMQNLRRAGYIETAAGPSGVVVRITKAKKFFKIAPSAREIHRSVEKGFPQPANLRPTALESEAGTPQMCGGAPRNCGASARYIADSHLVARGIRSREVGEQTKEIHRFESNLHSKQSSKNQGPKPHMVKTEEPEGFERVASGITLAALKAKMQQREWRLRREQREEALRRELRVGAGPQVGQG